MIYDRAATIARNAAEELNELMEWAKTQEDADAILDGFWDTLMHELQEESCKKLCECEY